MFFLDKYILNWVCFEEMMAISLKTCQVEGNSQLKNKNNCHGCSFVDNWELANAFSGVQNTPAENLLLNKGHMRAMWSQRSTTALSGKKAARCGDPSPITVSGTHLLCALGHSLKSTPTLASPCGCQAARTHRGPSLPSPRLSKSVSAPTPLT